MLRQTPIFIMLQYLWTSSWISLKVSLFDASDNIDVSDDIDASDKLTIPIMTLTQS